MGLLRAHNQVQQRIFGMLCQALYRVLIMVLSTPSQEEEIFKPLKDAKHAIYQLVYFCEEVVQ